jgi:hypothetical protein
VEQSTKFSTEHWNSLALVSLSWIVEIRNSVFIIKLNRMTKPEFGFSTIRLGKTLDLDTKFGIFISNINIQNCY